MANYRAVRVAQEIQREVNDILQKKVRDPRVQDVTITDVKLTGDLQQATIFYSVLDDQQIDKVQEGLNKATGLIRKLLGQRLSLYKVPELNFEHDTSLQYGSHIDELLRSIHKDDA